MTGDIASLFLSTIRMVVCGARPLVLSFLEMLLHLPGTLAILVLLLMRYPYPELLLRGNFNLLVRDPPYLIFTVNYQGNMKLN